MEMTGGASPAQNAADTAIKFGVPGNTTAHFRAFAMGGIASPTLNASSGWGDAPVLSEFMMVANTPGNASQTAVIDTSAHSTDHSIMDLGP